jgi:hypothetical protein
MATVLNRLDSRQFQMALDNAKANVAQIALAIEWMKVTYQRMLSDARRTRRLGSIRSPMTETPRSCVHVPFATLHVDQLSLPDRPHSFRRMTC